MVGIGPHLCAASRRGRPPPSLRGKGLQGARLWTALCSQPPSPGPAASEFSDNLYLLGGEVVGRKGKS